MSAPFPTKITGISGSYQGRTAPVASQVLTIGREQNHNLSFPLDPLLSRNHARLFFSGDSWFCEDLNSTNGTLVDGHVVRGKTVRLFSGSMVVCGSQAFRLDFEEPVSAVSSKVSSPTPPPKVYAVPPPPPAHIRIQQPQLKPVPQHSVTPAARWVRLHESIEIGGEVISCGGFFVGNHLFALNGYFQEPSLVDPSLKITFKKVYVDDPLRTESAGNPKPLFATFSPSKRGEYVKWLKGGRLQKADSLDYLQLFLMAIERRLLESSESVLPGEISVIERELEQVAERNREHSGFVNQVSNLLFMTSLLKRGTPPLEQLAFAQPDATNPLLSTIFTCAEFASADKPLTAKTAFAFVLQDFETYPRTPARRCPEQMRRLFELRFGTAIESGVKLKTNKGKLQLHYSAWNPGLVSPISYRLPSLQELSQNAAALTKLRELFSACTDELDQYSRRIGKRPEEADRLPAIALLPRDLLTDHPALQGLRVFRVNLEDEDRLVPMRDLRNLIFQNQSGDTLTKLDAQLIATSLETVGIAIEPDARYGSYISDVDVPVAVARIADADVSHLTPKFLANRALIDLAANIATADGTVAVQEQELVFSYIESVVQLGSNEQRRLKLYASWQFTQEAAKPSKGIIQSISSDERLVILEFLIGVAKADGTVSPSEIRVLLHIAKELNIAESLVYERVQEHAAQQPHPHNRSQPDEPSTPKPHQKASSSIIDMEAVHRKLAASEEVSKILGTIFADESPEPVSAILGSPDDSSSIPPEIRHIIEHLLHQETWTQTEFALLAKSQGLMPGATYEHLNDFAFSCGDDPFLDGEDIIIVDKEVGQKILG